jgi:hypothetical protein
MKIWTVSWTNQDHSQISPDNIKCFGEYKTAKAFVKLMSNNYSFVNMYRDEVTEWDS